MSCFPSGDLEYVFDVRNYEPGDHTLLVRAVGKTTNLTASDSTSFTTPPRLEFTCQTATTDSTFKCETLTNQIERISCSLGDNEECKIPLDLRTLSVGQHTVTVSATDMFFQTAEKSFDIFVPASISCVVSRNQDTLTFSFECTTNAESITCLYDGQENPTLPCELRTKSTYS